MGITALVSLEDATRNLSPNIYSVTLPSTTGVARFAPKTVTIDDWGVKPPKNVSTYATNNQGDRTHITTIYDWDNFKETWYTEAIKAGKPIWLRIFTWNYPNHPYIVASADRPIYDVQNRFLGMVAADIHLLSKNMVTNWNVFLLLVKEVS